MGGVFVAHDATPAQEVQFTALQYVTKKLFIAQVVLIQCVKVVKFSIRCTASSDFFCDIGLFTLNLYYIEGYTQRAKSALNPYPHKKVISQPSEIIC